MQRPRKGIDGDVTYRFPRLAEKMYFRENMVDDQPWLEPDEAAFTRGRIIDTHYGYSPNTNGAFLL